MWPAVAAARAPLLALKLRGVVGQEVPAGPIAVEDRGELGQDVGIPCRRCADIPFDSRDLGGVSEVRGAHVGGGKP